mgnify:CR=1 FL=1
MELTIKQQLEKLEHKPTISRSKAETLHLAQELLKKMTLAEKIGQMFQLAPPEANVEGLKWEHGEENSSAKLICEGKVGSVLSVTDSETIFKLQKLAVEKSRLGYDSWLPDWVSN